MKLSEILKKLKIELDDHANQSDFLLNIISDCLRQPTDENDLAAVQNGTWNPVQYLTPDMRAKIVRGKKNMPKEVAADICSKFDSYELTELIDNLYDTQHDDLYSYLTEAGLPIESNKLGDATQQILHQLFEALSHGDNDPSIHINSSPTGISLVNLSPDRVFFADGKLHIDGNVIEMPNTLNLSNDTIQDFEIPYVNALCAAYADALERDYISPKEIDSLPKKFRRDFQNQRKAYFAAESKQRNIRDIVSDGETEFSKLKTEIYNGVEVTYFDDYENGYERLIAVLKKVTDIQLTNSRLSIIHDMIGTLERKGIIHILVNDNNIKSWVDPYEE